MLARTCLEGAMRCLADAGGWRLGDVDLEELFDRFRNRFGHYGDG
jgi:hypothetical protein